jgi:hypothetical protein
MCDLPDVRVCATTGGAMAKVSIIYRWSTGETVQVCVEVEASYPDAVAEARHNAVAAFAEAFSELEDADE